MTTDEHYMSRCLALARLGKGFTAPNPLVGSVLVHDNTIIGEGYHRKYGGSHAEVEALQSISDTDRYKLKAATVYVNLEPCAHYGNTPPCADRLILEGVQRVVIGSLDNHSLVSGRGLQKLLDAGIECSVGILEAECRKLNVQFFVANTYKRPYITLKWAQDTLGNFGRKDLRQHWITQETTRIFTHKLRSEHQAIWVGTHTLLYDYPSLDNRYFTGNSPTKVVVDANGRIPHTHPIFEKGDVIYIAKKEFLRSNIHNCITVDFSLTNILHILYKQKICSLMVEGGAQIIRSFITKNLWDKAYRYTGINLITGEAIPSPQFTSVVPSDIFYLNKDKIEVFLNPCYI